MDQLIKPILLFTGLALALNVNAQTYAPPVGQTGTTAMYKDSSAFVSWASACTVTRGYMDASNTALGYASAGDNSKATGKADGVDVVSLGDGGSAICTFPFPIKNGSGPDFAVFENAFDNTFLELGFVEVSSDGVNFFRFPAHSLTDASTQTGSFGSTDATKINNLAGKYKAGYGTPFDLQELAGKPGLNINAVTHVKIVDVVGSINPAYATYDTAHNKVNDPWPTAFASGGFDLDAVGVIHQETVTGIREQAMAGAVQLYPNPVMQGQTMEIKTDRPVHSIQLRDLSGQLISVSQEPEVSTALLERGIYLLTVLTDRGSVIKKIIVH